MARSGRPGPLSVRRMRLWPSSWISVARIMPTPARPSTPSMASRALRNRFTRMRCSCSGSASTRAPGGVSMTSRTPRRDSRASSDAASRAARSEIGCLSGAGSLLLPKVSTLEASRMARSRARSSRGSAWATFGSPESARRSEAIWALVSMLRRSWLILATASPSAASRAREARAARRSACIRSSSASATPISSRRPDSLMCASGSLGLARNRCMARVIRCMGATSRKFREKNTTAPAIREVKAAMPSSRLSCASSSLRSGASEATISTKSPVT